MRTLNQPSGARPPDDRGAVLVIVAVIMVALLGIGALVIDLGALYVERRELQNGADAAALAIAQDCAGGDCGAAFATAEQFADLNAKDGLSTVDFVCGVGPGLQACTEPPPAGVEGALGWVRVTTSTETPDGDQVDFVLAPVMSALTGSTVHADAVAAWGALGSLAGAVPLIMSLCEFKSYGGKIDPLVLPEVDIMVKFHTTAEMTDCPAGPSGADAPGGFGWLDTEAGECQVTLDVDDDPWVGADTGNGVPQPCDPSIWPAMDPFAIALFDEINDLTGNNLEYRLLGFVALDLTGYAFPGNFWSAEGLQNARHLCGSSNTSCLTGSFTDFQVSSGEFGGTNFGVTVVKMVG